MKKKNKHIPQFFENLGKKVFHTVELLQRFIIGRYMSLEIVRLLRQPRLFFQAAAHHFRVRGIFLDKSHNSSHNQSLTQSGS